MHYQPMKKDPDVTMIVAFSVTASILLGLAILAFVKYKKNLARMAKINPVSTDVNGDTDLVAGK